MNLQLFFASSFLKECKIHMKSKLDIKYIVKNNGVRFQQKRTDTDRKEPTLIDDTN